MNKLLKADTYRMFSGKLLWIAVISIMVIYASFCAMQYKALDYKVAIDRVIFLPMVFYGVISAALTGLFAGGEYSDGIIRNKIISGHSRYSIYLSLLIAIFAASVTVYLSSLIITIGIGLQLFEINISYYEIIEFILMGMLTCTVNASIFFLVSILAGIRSKAVTLCMILSFFMLYISLTTNSALSAPEFKDGIKNIHYVGDGKRIIYEFLHNVNPTGQAAQLSMMKINNKTLFIVVDIIFDFICAAFGMFAFNQKDFK